LTVEDDDDDDDDGGGGGGAGKVDRKEDESRRLRREGKEDENLVREVDATGRWVREGSTKT
jgi:hypothetical protein